MYLPAMYFTTVQVAMGKFDEPYSSKWFYYAYECGIYGLLRKEELKWKKDLYERYLVLKFYKEEYLTNFLEDYFSGECVTDLSYTDSETPNENSWNTYTSCSPTTTTVPSLSDTEGEISEN